MPKSAVTKKLAVRRSLRLLSQSQSKKDPVCEPKKSMNCGKSCISAKKDCKSDGIKLASNKEGSRQMIMGGVTYKSRVKEFGLAEVKKWGQNDAIIKSVTDAKKKRVVERFSASKVAPKKTQGTKRTRTSATKKPSAKKTSVTKKPSQVRKK